MSLRYPSDIKFDLDNKMRELEEVTKRLSSLYWQQNQLEAQIATYGQAATPIEKLVHLRQTTETVRLYEARKKSLEADKRSLEFEFEEAQSLQKERYRLETGQTLDPTLESLERLIEETRALINKSEKQLTPKLASYYRECARLAQRKGDNQTAKRSFQSAQDSFRASGYGYETEILETQYHLFDLLMNQADDLSIVNPEAAIKNYLHALNISRNLDSYKDLEIRVLGELARLHEALNNLTEAITYRLDTIECLKQLNRSAEIYVEIKSIRNLCRRLYNQEPAQHRGLEILIVITKPFFYQEEDKDGLRTVREIAREFRLTDSIDELTGLIRELEDKHNFTKDSTSGEDKLPDVEINPVERLQSELRLRERNLLVLDDDIAKYSSEEDAPSQKVNERNHERAMVERLKTELRKLRNKIGLLDDGEK